MNASTFPSSSVTAFLDFPDATPDAEATANGEDPAARETRWFAHPLRTLCATTLDDVIPTLRAAEAEAHAGRWILGFVAYEAAPAFDAALTVRPPDPHAPLAAFAVFDHPEDAPCPLSEDTSHGATCDLWQAETPARTWMQRLESTREAIAAGAYYQTNLTGRWHAALTGDSWDLFQALRAAQPGGHGLYLNLGEIQVCSVSPEMFFAWDPESRALVTRPMKGTADPENPGDLEALRTSAKDRAENLMIVDLLRNDLAKIAERDSVRVPTLYAITRLPSVLQMTSTVTCRTREDVTLTDVFRALFPCGSITGAPKVAAMKAIATNEDSPRGAYCGALGVIRPGGACRWSVGIRTVTVQKGQATYGAGSGITWDSRPEAELAEWTMKRRFVNRATASFSLLETLRLEEGCLVEGDRHLARLQRGARHFGFALNENAAREALSSLQRAHPHGTWRVRLQTDRAGLVQTDIVPLPATPPVVTVALATAPLRGEPEFLIHKTTERSAYAPFAPPLDSGIFDTLLFNDHEEITEFTRGNVAFTLGEGGPFLTPPVACGLLPGIRREVLLESGALCEGLLRLRDLPHLTGLWFLNSLRGVIPAQGTFRGTKALT